MLNNQPPSYWQRACQHLMSADSVMRSIIPRLRSSFLCRRSSAFTVLCRAVVGQQISVQAADTIWGNLSASFPLFDAAVVSNLDQDELVACGLSKNKAACMKGITRYFIQNKADRDNYWQSMSDEAVFRQLTAMKGVGPWTYQMFAIFFLEHPDILPTKDLGLMNSVRKLYNAGDPLDAVSLEKITAKWSPWRTVASWYLWRNMDASPVEY